MPRQRMEARAGNWRARVESRQFDSEGRLGFNQLSQLTETARIPAYRIARTLSGSSRGSVGRHYRLASL